MAATPVVLVAPSGMPPPGVAHMPVTRSLYVDRIWTTEPKGTIMSPVAVDDLWTPQLLKSGSSRSTRLTII